MRALLVLIQLVVLVASLTLAGCASTSTEEADEYNTFHADPEKQEDGHGWGVSVQQQGGH